jgi:hypothetical protein
MPQSVAREAIAYGQKTKSFLQPPSCSGGLQVALTGCMWPQGDLGGSGVASGGHMWPQVVLGGLMGLCVASGGPG